MLANSVKGLVRAIKRHGVRGTARKVVAQMTGQSHRFNSIDDYEFILGEEQGFGLKLSSSNLPADTMTWLIPDFEASSGGHINIFRMMNLLKTRGFSNQHVVIMEPHRWSSTNEASAAIERSFGISDVTVSLGVRSIEPCTYLVATGWQTAYWVSKYKDAVHWLYFVQDFEPDFYPRGSEYSFAENTYRLGLTGLTAGTWLADKLSHEYGMTTFPYLFACDTDNYKPTPKRHTGKRNIFFYARPVTPRRCFELGMLALKQVCEAIPDASVVLAGWDVSGSKVPFPHRSVGSVRVTELPDLYSQCDVALVLSSTNLSLLPLEVAACRCPVVLNRGPHTSWLLSDDEATYCDLNVESIAEAVIRVLNRPEEAKTKAAAAFDRSQRDSWETEADKVSGFLKSLAKAI